MISFFRSEYLISLSDNNCFTVCWSWVRQGVIVLLSLLILGRSFNWDREMRWDDDVVGINWMRIVGVTKKTQYLNDNVSDLLGRSISFLYLTIIALLLILGKTRRNCILLRFICWSWVGHFPVGSNESNQSYCAAGYIIFYLNTCMHQYACNESWFLSFAQRMQKIPIVCFSSPMIYYIYLASEGVESLVV